MSRKCGIYRAHVIRVPSVINKGAKKPAGVILIAVTGSFSREFFITK